MSNDEELADTRAYRSAIEFGELKGITKMILSELNEVKTRLVFRLDSLEGRVETLELQHAGATLYDEIVKKGIFAIAGGVGGYIITKFFGVIHG